MRRLDYIAHYGILGMKWGIRRFQNEDGSLTPAGKKRYGNSIISKANSKNLEKWGKSADTNVLYITGQSGSGKSTAALSLADKSTSVIHLDSYFDNPDGPHSKSFDSFLQKNCPDYVKLSWPKDQISLTDWGKVASKFEKQIEAFGQSEYKNGNKVICEGVQLLDDTLRPDKSFFSSKPVIVTNTNPVVSAYRSAKRDDVRLRDVNDLVNTINWYRETGNDVKAFNKTVGMRR